MNTVKIGWGIREFSLDVSCNISGQMHMRRSRGILDPLMVTALCAEGVNGEIVLFISADMAALSDRLMEEVAASVHEACPGVPAEAVIMNATHTHTSFDISSTGEVMPDGKPYFNGVKCFAHLKEQAVLAATEAYESRKPGGIAYGYGYAVVAHSRRVLYSEDMSKIIKNRTAPNGHAIMYGKTAREQFSGYEAGADHFLNALFTFDAEDALTGIVVNVPCPSQTSEQLYMLSADYWNEVRAAVRKEFGENVKVLPQCAAAGDLSPRILHYGKAQARRMALKYNLPYDLTNTPADSQDYFNKVMSERYDIAERILAGLTDIFSWAQKDIQKEIPVRHVKRTPLVHKRLVTAEEREWCLNEIREMEAEIPDPDAMTPEEYVKAKSAYDSVVRRNQTAVKRFDEEKDSDGLTETIIHAVEIGDVAFATTKYEIFQDFMHRIQARSPFIQTFYVQLCGSGTYLATKRGQENKGYSASMFCNRISYEGGQDIVENTLEMLAEMKAEDEK